MLIPLNGLREDPATGTANNAFAAYLRCLGVGGPVIVEQGFEIDRPSRLYLDVVDSIRVGGKVHPVLTGTFAFRSTHPSAWGYIIKRVVATAVPKNRARPGSLLRSTHRTVVAPGAVLASIGANGLGFRRLHLGKLRRQPLRHFGDSPARVFSNRTSDARLLAVIRPGSRVGRSGGSIQAAA